MNKKETILIYTDGGCRGNPGLGAWGAILKTSKYRLEIGASLEHTTNNKMELSAALFAIKRIKHTSNIELYSDSSYLVNGMNKWIENWVKNGWVKSDKKEVENKDIWKSLYKESKKHTVTFQWVKAHNGNEENEKVDEIVNILMDEHSSKGHIASLSNMTVSSVN